MQKASENILCPLCGGKVRIFEYKLGGGQVDCFRCRTSVRVLPHKAGHIISKHIFPIYSETQRHRGPVLTDYVITETKLPIILGRSVDYVRQVTKEGAIA